MWKQAKGVRKVITAGKRIKAFDPVEEILFASVSFASCFLCDNRSLWRIVVVVYGKYVLLQPRITSKHTADRHRANIVRQTALLRLKENPLRLAGEQDI